MDDPASPAADPGAAPAPLKYTAPLTCPACAGKFTGHWTGRKTADQRCPSCGHVAEQTWPGWTVPAALAVRLSEEERTGGDVCACGLPIVQEHGIWFHVDALRAGSVGAARGCRAALFYVDSKAWLRCVDQGKARPKTAKTRAHQRCVHSRPPRDTRPGPDQETERRATPDGAI